MIRTVLMAACLAAMTFFALACNGGSEEAPTSTHTPPATATPTPVAELRHTGIAEVDTVIDAVASSDRATLRELILFQDIPCVGPTPSNLGGPPLCQEDEPFGTVVAVLRSIGCHGDYGREDSILNMISGLPASPYAAYRTEGGYLIVYSYSPGAEAIGAGLVVEEGRITALTNRCAQGPESFIEGIPPERFVLPPPQFDEPRTGIAEIDAVLDAVFAGDEDAVRALIGYTATACATNPQGLGSPPQCIEHEADGTLIDMFAVGYCHGVYVRPENMGSVISTLSRAGARLRAVSAIEDAWPDGDYVAVYDHVRGTNRVPHNALVLVLRDGAIVGILDGCQGTPDEFLEGRELDDPILFIPPVGLTGIRDLDMVLDGLALDDPDVMGAFITYEAIPCITTPEGIGAPPLCRPEEPLGERVEVFPLNTCELEYRRRDEMGDVRRWLADAILHAVYATEAAHQIVMRWAPPDDDLMLVATVEGRHIVGIEGCGLSVFEVLDDVPPEDILVGPLWP